MLLSHSQTRGKPGSVTAQVEVIVSKQPPQPPPLEGEGEIWQYLSSYRKFRNKPTTKPKEYTYCVHGSTERQLPMNSFFMAQRQAESRRVGSS